MVLWYVAAVPGSEVFWLMIYFQMIVGGTHEAVAFYNIDPVDSFEFFPPKDGGVPRPSEFLARSGPANLFPRYVQPQP